MRSLDHDPVVFLTMHHTTPLDASRYAFRLANAMYERGIETMMINLGRSLPRPDWILPAFYAVEHPSQLHLILDRMRPHIVIGTTPDTAFMAHDDAMFSGAMPYYLMNGTESRAALDPIEAHLQSSAIRLGEVLAPTPRIAASVRGVSANQVHLIGVAVDTGLSAETTGTRRNVIFSFDQESPNQNIVDGCRTAAQASGGSLRAAGFGYTSARISGATHTVLPWSTEDSPDRSRLFSAGAAFVHPTLNASLELSALDAMACDCPVVAVPSETTESICLDGENCVFASDDSAGAIAEAVSRVTRDHQLAARVVEGGRRTVKDMTWENVMGHLPAIIREQQRNNLAIGVGAVNRHK